MPCQRVLAILLLTACSTSEETFGDDFAEEQCRALETCEPEVFGEAWSSSEDCEAEAFLERNHRSETFATWMIWYDLPYRFEPHTFDLEVPPCEFDGADARRCLQSLRQYAFTCDDAVLDQWACEAAVWCPLR